MDYELKNTIEKAAKKISDNFGKSIENVAQKLNSNILTVNDNLTIVESDVANLENRLNGTRSELNELIKKFDEFLKAYNSDRNINLAETRIIKITQELETKYGYYNEIRRMATGILHAYDDALVRRETLSNITEESVLKAPGYWLSAALLALAAWINNDRELSTRAVKKAISIDDNRTSLFFMLVCRRANRTRASIKWLYRYLSNQNPNFLSRNMVIALDSYVSGILGNDSENLIYGKLAEWLDQIVDQTDFANKQHTLWINFMKAQRGIVREENWKYLSEYSQTWPKVKTSLENLDLHSNLYNHLSSILEAHTEPRELIGALDKMMDDLVTRYDDEELELRKSKRLNEVIVECEGDVERANIIMESEKEAYVPDIDYATLLNTVITNPKVTNCSVSIQKYALSQCKPWIEKAYRDTVSNNRSEIPNEIILKIEDFETSTEDGSNEIEMLGKVEGHYDKKLKDELKRNGMPLPTHLLLVGGAALIGLGIYSLPEILGIALSAVGAGLSLVWITKLFKTRKNKKKIRNQYDEKIETVKGIVRAIAAEVVDYRNIIKNKDKTDKIDSLFDVMDPKQMVMNAPGSLRKIGPNSMR